MTTIIDDAARAIYETDPRADEDGYWMPWEIYKHADDQEYERLIEAAKAALRVFLNSPEVKGLVGAVARISLLGTGDDYGNPQFIAQQALNDFARLQAHIGEG